MIVPGPFQKMDFSIADLPPARERRSLGNARSKYKKGPSCCSLLQSPFKLQGRRLEIPESVPKCILVLGKTLKCPRLVRPGTRFRGGSGAAGRERGPRCQAARARPGRGVGRPALTRQAGAGVCPPDPGAVPRRSLPPSCKCSRSPAGRVSRHRERPWQHHAAARPRPQPARPPARGPARPPRRARRSPARLWARGTGGRGPGAPRHPRGGCICQDSGSSAGKGPPGPAPPCAALARVCSPRPSPACAASTAAGAAAVAVMKSFGLQVLGWGDARGRRPLAGLSGDQRGDPPPPPGLQRSRVEEGPGVAAPASPRRSRVPGLEPASPLASPFGGGRRLEGGKGVLLVPWSGLVPLVPSPARSPCLCGSLSAGLRSATCRLLPAP